MHYGPYAFAKDRQKPTIIPLSNVPIGQREAFSEVKKLWFFFVSLTYLLFMINITQNDVVKIKKLYECGNVEESSTLTKPDSNILDESKRRQSGFSFLSYTVLLCRRR